jgi:phosphoribosylglycinamide formyltransferase 1
MVHYVDEGVDTGQVIVVEDVPIHGTDTHDTLETRVHPVEHRLIIEAIRGVMSHDS